jgi:hypothetical protein
LKEIKEEITVVLIIIKNVSDCDKQNSGIPAWIGNKESNKIVSSRPILLDSPGV